jgi:hypothetical protein
MYSYNISLTSTLDGGEWQRHAPAALTPDNGPVHNVHVTWCAPGSAWTGAENLTPLAFGPRTFQPVACRYSDRAIPVNASSLVVILTVI